MSQPTNTGKAADGVKRSRFARMVRWLLRLVFGGRRAVLTVPLVLVGGWVGFVALRYQLFYHSVSVGSRTGIVRKLSSKQSSQGTPFCRYISVEMVMSGTKPGNVTDLWVFSVDDERPDGPVMKRLHDAEKSAQPITVDYRQDLHRFWACSESEYFVTGVE